jgi:hypothetical protein
MDDSEVTIHTPDGLHKLLLGKQSRIGPERPRRGQGPKPVLDGIDGQKYPFPEEISLLTFKPPPAAKRGPESDVDRSLHRVPMANYTRLRSEQSRLHEATDYLEFYEHSATRKGLLLHQEMEKHYLQPLNKRVVKRITGRAYDRYLRTRSCAVSAFDTAVHRTDTFNTPPPPIPIIRVNISGLRDPIVKYKYANATEEKLAKVIAESGGITEEAPRFQERDTMDLKKWKTLAETRFYAGVLEKPAAKGRRSFERHGKSSIASQIDAFAPEEAKPRCVRKQWGHQRDHLAEQW